MDEKRAVAGLWAVPGAGAGTVAKLRKRYGSLGHLADWLIGEWCDEADLPTRLLECIPRGRTLGDLGDELFDAVARGDMKIAWVGEPSYPQRLAQTRHAPPLLFYRGPGTAVAPRRRIAMVGCRHPDARCVHELKPIIREVAEQGIGVVSGAALGIDSVAHTESALAGGETWGFLGSALDAIDRHQLELWDIIGPLGATYWSELPPGVRASDQTFPRRNRLISGASDAVALLRGTVRSGARHTVTYAWAQERPVLAYPGDGRNPRAALPNELIKKGWAQLFNSAADVMRAVGVTGLRTHRPPSHLKPSVPLSALSESAQRVHAAIDTKGCCFDELVEQLSIAAGPMLVALTELISAHYVVEHAGRRYQRV